MGSAVGVAALGAQEALVVRLLAQRLHPSRPRHLLKELILQPGAQVLAALPHAVDRRSVLVEGPLPAEVHRLHVAERVRHDVVVQQLVTLDEPRQLPEHLRECGRCVSGVAWRRAAVALPHHVEVAVAPVRVVREVLAEDRAKRRLVLGDQSRPLLEHVPHPVDDRGGVRRRVAHLRRHRPPEERRQPAGLQVDHLHVRRRRLEAHGVVERSLVEDEPIDEERRVRRRLDEVRQPRRQRLARARRPRRPRQHHPDAELGVARRRARRGAAAEEHLAQRRRQQRRPPGADGGGGGVAGGLVLLLQRRELGVELRRRLEQLLVLRRLRRPSKRRRRVRRRLRRRARPPPYDGGAGARWSSCAGSAVSSWRSTTRHSSDASSISAARRCAARLCRSERAKSRAFINWLSIFIRTTLKTSDGTEPASPWKVSFSRRGEMSMSAMPPAAERESIAEIARRAQKCRREEEVDSLVRPPQPRAASARSLS